MVPRSVFAVLLALILTMHSAKAFFHFEHGFDEQDEGDEEQATKYQKDLDPNCQYYCEDSDTCVDTPVECPCPSVHSTKCKTDDWYVCLEPGVDCASFSL
ncbi:hypothetical protein SARC_11665 [Sphaeroforma arctica JP610]|uniref:Long chronological lifespan protein 2 n=1 Tax=Sphaeroforma arctica JP610 TaxID=667725 RepID=A0A0L0FH58_9EUKA|nr:hypothetical protein SARC_11665 [Sphaeroforma arctica JP610]KNC75816.1 hypothetical protein SARC_11665 [Sphaeroforma arctica JP610]|eukprot:XP_014149718.1 hypothetical protein SARC_11665 [Sphaeroforma arctica JP610]